MHHKSTPKLAPKRVSVSLLKAVLPVISCSACNKLFYADLRVYTVLHTDSDVAMHRHDKLKMM